MLQRPQTVYLILASILLLLTLFVDLGTITAELGNISLSATCAPEDLVGLKGHWFFIANIACIALGILLAVFAISQFKNRPKQIKIVYALFFIVLLEVINVLYTPGKVINTLEGGLQYTEGVGTYLPIAAIAFCILALKGIRKDEELVKSIDRIR